MKREAQWQPVRSQAICWREWDDEFVLFNDDTGSTHHLNALGGEVLLELLRNPQGIGEDALVLALEERFEPAPGVEMAAEVGRVLAQLTELEIARKRDPDVADDGPH